MHASELIQHLQRDAALRPLMPALAEGRQEGQWLAATDLLRPETLASLLAEFACREGYPDGDSRAIASLWSRWHFWAVLPPFIAALLLHRCAPTLHTVQLSPAYRSCGLQWQPSVQVFPPHSAGLASEMTVHQARPLVLALAAHSRASPKVFWSNLGNLLEYVISEWRHHPGVCPDMLQAFDNLLTCAQLSDGSANPLQHPVRYLPDNQAETATLHRTRRICCLYYLLPEQALCSNCPRPLSKPCHVRT